MKIWITRSFNDLFGVRTTSGAKITAPIEHLVVPLGDETIRVPLNTHNKNALRTYRDHAKRNDVPEQGAVRIQVDLVNKKIDQMLFLTWTANLVESVEPNSLRRSINDYLDGASETTLRSVASTLGLDS